MSGHTSSLTHVARTVLAGAVIGFGALATAGQASADPVAAAAAGRASSSRTARAGSPRGRGRRCASAATSWRTVRAGGPEPAVWIGTVERPVGLPAGRLASSQGPLQFRRNAAWRDAPRGPTAAGSRSGAAAATRIRIAELPGVQRASRDGFIRRRAAATAWVLPVERAAAAARVLGAACRPGRAAGNGTDSGRASAGTRH